MPSQAKDATVLVRPDLARIISVSTEDLSDQQRLFVDKWQAILDTLRLVADVPAALIMRVSEAEIEVHAASSNKENVYTVGAKESLGIGLYCESVMGNDRPLCVPDALNDEDWKNNPDVPLGMVAYYGTPVKWKDGSFFGTLCILDAKANEFSKPVKDLVEVLRSAIEADLFIQQMLTELKAAKEKAEEVSHAKSEFLSLVSHELRTPLNPITALSEILKQHSNDAEIQRYASIMSTSANQLLLLINDLLDMSKIDSSQLDMHKTYCSLRQLLNETIDLFRQRIEKSGLTLVAPDEFMDCQIYADASRIRQILINLIDNAIKFTARGYVAVDWHQFGDKIAVTIRDSGIGIDPDQQAQMFDAFSQADSSYSRPFGGIGLGLALSNGLAKLHGGEITLESTPGHGSCFTLWLPKDRTSAASDTSSSKKASPFIAGII